MTRDRTIFDSGSISLPRGLDAPTDEPKQRDSAEPAPPLADDPEITCLGSGEFKLKPIAGVRLSGDAGEFILRPGPSTIGRGADQTVRIESREVSRRHAVITVTADDVVVEDRGSANGTFVNGTPLTGPRSLIEGDRVAVATFEFRVEIARLDDV